MQNICKQTGEELVNEEKLAKANVPRMWMCPGPLGDVRDVTSESHFGRAAIGQ